MSKLSDDELDRCLTDDEMLIELESIHLQASKRTGAVVQIHHYDRGTTNFVWSEEKKRWCAVSASSGGDFMTR